MRIKTRYDFVECVQWKLPSEAGHFLMRFARFAGIKGFDSTRFCVFRTGHASYVGSCLLQSRKTERTPQRNQAFRIASMLFSGCAAEKCVKESTASQTVLGFAPSNWRFCLDAE